MLSVIVCYPNCIINHHIQLGIFSVRIGVILLCSVFLLSYVTTVVINEPAGHPIPLQTIYLAEAFKLEPNILFTFLPTFSFRKKTFNINDSILFNPAVFLIEKGFAMPAIHPLARRFETSDFQVNDSYSQRCFWFRDPQKRTLFWLLVSVVMYDYWT